MGRILVAWLLALATLTLIVGCGGTTVLGGGSRNRNAALDIDLGGASPLRSRLINIIGRIAPEVFGNETVGQTERYTLTLAYSLDNGATFLPATLLSPGGVQNSITDDFPVGQISSVVFLWDRDADIGVDLQDQVNFRLTATQVDSGSGTGLVSKGPVSVDTRGSGPCSEKTPRISQTTVNIAVGAPVDVPIPVEFGQAPLSWTINEPLQGGIAFTAGGHVVGTLSGAGTAIRLVTVTDSCGARVDAAWITFRGQ